ncbi:MAG: RNA polymerase sigma factor [bacterium]
MAKISFFPEKEFINRIKSNDRTVLGELLVRYKKMVFAYIKSRGGDDTDAEDMLQEAIIVLWQKVCSGQFELTSKLGTYILAVAKNKWMAEMRKRGKTTDVEMSVERADGNPSSLDRVIKEEQYDTVHKALDAINPLCKKLLLLFYFEERNFKDICRILGFANTYVAKSKKYQCKKAFERAFKKLVAETERSV